MSECLFCGADRALPDGSCGACGCPAPFYYTGKDDCSMTPVRHATLAAAEAWIADRQKSDPAGVERGDYYIDAPADDWEPAGRVKPRGRARCPDCGIPTIPDREGLTEDEMRCDRCEAKNEQADNDGALYCQFCLAKRPQDCDCKLAENI